MKLLNRFSRPLVGGLLVAAVVVGLSSISRADGTNSAAASAKPTPYPLKTCVVSDEKLGDMGDPIVFIYENKEKGINQEVKFCCPSCKPKFVKDPDKYMKNIQDAEKKAKDKAAKN
jgi:hypothetical protein